MIFLVALAAVSGLDIATSLWGFSHGLSEGAPFMAAVVSVGGPLAIVPARVLLMAALYGLTLRVERRLPLQAVALAILSTAVVSNILLIQAS